MKKDVLVSDIMTKNLYMVATHQSLFEAQKMFSRHGVRHLPVVEKGKLVGVLSHSDLLRISFADLDTNDETIVPLIYEMYSIPMLMSHVPVTVEASDTVMTAAEILSKQSFHSLPVVEDGHLVGIVTTTDLINYLISVIKGQRGDK